ncbi:hypothetical protein SRABI118_04229 [Massilia sp. Bi118]|uniref:hypothetical protein n=1 Tax=Massilia sp. Bi118 TaxID=2822346 RepID=UPI001DA907E7|nr:hypothetical protein [Massilia sp. Bi118]CAH0296067.1 hypothetical protein SRABI118_04229 [Massilia sp. Bi118]
MPITGRAVCEGSMAAVGVAFGAIAGAGPMSLPAMLGGGAVGYIIGKAVCRLPALQRAFERYLNLDDLNALERVLADPPTRVQAVALVEEEVGVDRARAEQIWDAAVAAFRRDPGAVQGSAAFAAAARHPATGAARHGIAVLNLTTPRPA